MADVDELTVRPLRATDADWLFDLHTAAHRDLVEHEGRRRGAAYLGLRDDNTWLELMEIEPASQGLGLGTHLLEWVLERSAAEGRGVLLQVHKVNDGARRPYLRMGFLPAGQTATHHLLQRARTG